MAEHEVTCFGRQSGVSAERLHVHNLTEGPASLEKILHYDAVFLGGSGQYYASKGDLPHFEQYMDLLRELIERDHPVLGVCYGFHCIARALGAAVINDAARTEVGTYDLTLTEPGTHDPLVGQLPKQFRAQMGHKDQVTELPEGVVNLCSSELSPNQAFRIGETSIWAVQFHPELNRATNRDRFAYYLEGYSGHMTEEEREATFSKFEDSHDASRVLGSFLDLVFG